MEAETQKKVELLKEKGLTIKEIKEILNLTNHDLYPENKEDPKSETAQEGKPKATEIDDRFTAIKISSNRAVNDFAKDQEKCLLKLIEHIETPFKDKWEYQAWHRWAMALQLDQHDKAKFPDFFNNNRALWGNLIEGAKNLDGTPVTKDKREWVISLIHNYLEYVFALARNELAYREREQGGMD